MPGTSLIYRLEHIETGKGPWDLQDTWLCLSHHYYYPTLDRDVRIEALERWHDETYFGFISIRQLVKYFPLAADRAPEYLTFAVYEVEPYEWLADKTQAVFNRRRAIRLHRAPCRDIEIIRRFHHA